MPVHRRHDRFEPQAADHDAIADRRRSAGGLGGLGVLDRLQKVSNDFVDSRPRSDANRPRIAGRDRMAGGLVLDGAGLRLEIGDDLVDLPARLAHLRLELLVQPAAEGLLALAERVFALAHAHFSAFERFPFADGETLLVLERPHVAIDLHEVLGELRLARAQFCRAAATTDGFNPRRPAISSARLRPADP